MWQSALVLGTPALSLDLRQWGVVQYLCFNIMTVFHQVQHVVVLSVCGSYGQPTKGINLPA